MQAILNIKKSIMSISKTRQKLVDVARQLFAKNGIANTTNEMILLLLLEKDDELFILILVRKTTFIMLLLNQS